MRTTSVFSVYILLPSFPDGESQFGVVIANTIGYLLDLGGPRGDIIKGVTNLQLHHGTGKKIRKIVEG